MSEYMVLVDEQDNEIGVLSKMETHRQGLLHRAFSVFVFNSAGALLLQQRAADKYHSPLLWTNTCCSHPRPGEPVEEGAFRRLYEEMGIIVQLTGRFSFVYKASLDNGLTEHEFDHVFVGYSDNAPIINAIEAHDWKYMDMEELRNDVGLNPGMYTEWLKICITQHFEKLLPTKN